MRSIIFGTTTISGEQFDERVVRAAAVLASLGVGPGDGLAIMLRNEPTFLEASQAAGALGAYAVAINWHALATDVKFVLEDSGARVLVIHADLLASIRDGVPERVKVVVVETPAEILDEYAIAPEKGRVPVGVTEWAAWRDSFAPRTEVSEIPPMTIFYTSGTTGRPKGVKRPPMSASQMEAFSNMLARSYGFLGDYGKPHEIVTVVTGPMYHGLPNGHANFAVRAGAKTIIMPRFEPEALLHTIQQHRVTHLNMVPIMFNRLLHLSEAVRARYDLSSLRFVAHAAAPIAPGVKREMIAWWGKLICEYYGATETGNVAFCTADEWLAHPGTVGKAAPGTEIRIVDAQGRQLPPGEVGDIVCRIHGAGDMTYMNNDAARRGIELVPGLLTAGDIGYLDADGFLYICDRSKDMIISGGVNIYPAQIEGVLQKMPGVADCAVFGIPDAEYGESVHAVIEPAAAATLDAAQVKAYLRQHIAAYMIPKSIDFARDLPREDSGKLFKRKLREPFWSGTGRSI